MTDFIRSSNQTVAANMLGEIRLIVKEEKWRYRAQIPQYGVERGADVSDQIKADNDVLDISGVIMWDKFHGRDFKERTLREYLKAGRILTYVGRFTHGNFAIESLDIDVTKKQNAYPFKIALQEVRFAEKAVKPANDTLKTQSTVGKQQTTGGGNEVYHVLKKGDTYIKLGKQYGTDWKQIKQWAGYADTKLPVGKKVRVK